METKRKALGKGLEQLFSNEVIDFDNFEKKIVNESKDSDIVEIPLTEIRSNPYQPRKEFDEKSLSEFAESIKEHGVIQPIIVKKSIKGYEIIAGERRTRASKMAGKTTIPAIIRDFSDQEMMEIALIENIQREDLNPIEKATALKEIIEKYGMKQHELASKLGISRSGIANTMRILNLDPRVIELVKQGHISEGHCRSLLNIEDPDKQYRAALYVIETGDSVREVEKQMKIKKKEQSIDQTRYEPIYREIEDRFRNFFGSQVKLNAGKRSGTIVIHYNSKDELNSIIDKIQ